MTRKEKVKNLLTELIDMIDNGSQRDLDRANEIGTSIIELLEQEPKTGHWMEEDMFDGDVAYRCSECNELFWIESGTPKDNGYNFCPKCGKRLVEPQESEEV